MGSAQLIPRHAKLHLSMPMAHKQNNDPWPCIFAEASPNGISAANPKTCQVALEHAYGAQTKTMTLGHAFLLKPPPNGISAANPEPHK
jgi:hypothetical protein